MFTHCFFKCSPICIYFSHSVAYLHSCSLMFHPFFRPCSANVSPMFHPDSYICSHLYKALRAPYGALFWGLWLPYSPLSDTLFRVPMGFMSLRGHHLASQALAHPKTTCRTMKQAITQHPRSASSRTLALATKEEGPQWQIGPKIGPKTGMEITLVCFWFVQM